MSASRLKLAIFDIDNTLFGDDVHTPRPHLRELLLFLLEQPYEVALWSTATSDHVADAVWELDEIAGTTMPWKFVYSIDHCESGASKDMREVAEEYGLAKDEFVLVDDCWDHCLTNAKSGYVAHKVVPFYGGNEKDTALLEVIEKLS
jgi:FMN phosphatase YigB (HAD superfamily)